MREKPFTSS